jgi:hypothetical protein
MYAQMRWRLHGCEDMESPNVVPTTQRTVGKLVPSELEPAPSKAAIAGHPIHPMLIPFPLALLTLVPVTDIVYATTDSAPLLGWSTSSASRVYAAFAPAGLTCCST